MKAIKGADGQDELTVWRDEQGIWITVDDNAAFESSQTTIMLSKEGLAELIAALKGISDVDA